MGILTKQFMLGVAPIRIIFLDHFREKYKPVTEVTLRKNYRSTEIILQASNDILEAIQTRGV